MKQVKRIKNNVGEFTTVPYNILRDNNLTPTAKLLLIEILSDRDDFDLSQSVYCKRLGISTGGWYKSIQNLIKFGYIKRTKKKIDGKGIYYDYIIDESGSLSTPTDEVKLDPFKEDNEVSDINIPKIEENVLNTPQIDKEEKDNRKNLSQAELRRTINIVEPGFDPEHFLFSEIIYNTIKTNIKIDEIVLEVIKEDVDSITSVTELEDVITKISEAI